MSESPEHRLANIPFPQGELDRLPQRKWILNHAPKNGVGAEIGVFRGHFSVVLCEVLTPKKLYLIDPWTKLGETFGWGATNMYTNFGQLTTLDALNDTKRRVAKFKEIDIMIFEATANDILPNLNEKFDWVYLDAEHSYNATLHELRLIHKTIKPNGVVMGDDWYADPQHKHHGVFLAVNQFVKNHPYDFIAAGPAGQWCIKKKPKKPVPEPTSKK